MPYCESVPSKFSELYNILMYSTFNFGGAVCDLGVAEAKEMGEEEGRKDQDGGGGQLRQSSQQASEGVTGPQGRC